MTVTLNECFRWIVVSTVLLWSLLLLRPMDSSRALGDSESARVYGGECDRLASDGSCDKDHMCGPVSVDDCAATLCFLCDDSTYSTDECLAQPPYNANCSTSEHSADGCGKQQMGGCTVADEKCVCETSGVTIDCPANTYDYLDTNCDES